MPLAGSPADCGGVSRRIYRAVAGNNLVPLTLNRGGVADTQALYTAVHQ